MEVKRYRDISEVHEGFSISRINGVIKVSIEKLNDSRTVLNFAECTLTPDEALIAYNTFGRILGIKPNE